MTLEQLEKELRIFDWLYAMSDDHCVYLAGLGRNKELYIQAMNLGQEGLDLYIKIQKEKLGG